MAIEFEKYQRRGAGYHWDEDSSDPVRMNAFVKARYALCVKLLQEYSGDIKDRCILDFGCGDGVLSYRLFKEGARVKGIDSSALAIDFAKARHSALCSTAEFVCGSCYTTPFGVHSFDAAISTDVIEHVDDVEAFCKELVRVVKPGGFVILSTPIRITEAPLDKNHVQEWYPEEFRKMLSRFFKVVDLKKSHPVFWYELYCASEVGRRMINLLSLAHNPFLQQNSRWRLFSLQYAVCQVPTNHE